MQASEQTGEGMWAQTVQDRMADDRSPPVAIGLRPTPSSGRCAATFSPLGRRTVSRTKVYSNLSDEQA